MLVRRCSVSLRVGLSRENFGRFLREFESQQPFAWRVASVNLRWGESPPAGYLHSLVPKKLAGKIVQVRAGHFAGVVYMNFYAHANRPLYGVASALRDIGHHLVEHRALGCIWLCHLGGFGCWPRFGAVNRTV